jgi:hypothetical protein
VPHLRRSHGRAPRHAGAQRGGRDHDPLIPSPSGLGCTVWRAGLPGLGSCWVFFCGSLTQELSTLWHCQRAAAKKLLMIAKLMSRSVCFEPISKSALYQGTTSVGPKRASRTRGFSPCGAISLSSASAAFRSSTCEEDITFAAFNNWDKSDEERARARGNNAAQTHRRGADLVGDRT